ncbi:hypothetical protein HG536_0E05980 [Torulaspora globosa]|uniref:Uncharacterized protein n=1 Tax=Torulaspora globosa TaxID=48254 RepID=A0A7G3ZJJ9_9SACH|nr:uncharacterized protein HG536_0E05980 [Torulaspora globosa]QLL33685.1 hypothetical protein HG536_0E05980 [Torulaspora globosa]
MMMDDKQYEAYLEEIKPCYKDPFRFLDKFNKEKDEIYFDLLLMYNWYLNLLRSQRPIKALESERGLRLSDVFSQTSIEIHSGYFRIWTELKEQEIGVPEFFNDSLKSG